MPKDNDPNQVLDQVSKDLKQVSDDIKKTAENAATEMKNLGKVTQETKEAADKLLVKHTELDARMKDLEQKVAERGRTGDPAEAKSPGQQVIENEEVKAFMARKARGSVKVPIKAHQAITTVNAGDLVVPQRQPGIVASPQRRMTIRNLLAPGRTSSNAIEFVRETGFTNAAAVVGENTAKPESSLTFELVTRGVKTIAHWIRASKQILDDAPMLQSYIDGRLRYGLQLEEEDELLNGDNTGQHLDGLIVNATAFAASFSPTMESNIDKIRLAMLQTFLAEYPASGTVLNPIDWARIELTKDSEGRYILANPAQMTGPTLWGKPVVETQAMDEDEFLVGAFELAAQIFDREDPTVEISTEDADNFTKNMVTIRGEERLVLAVYRPESFVHGDFGNVT